MQNELDKLYAKQLLASIFFIFLDLSSNFFYPLNVNDRLINEKGSRLLSMKQKNRRVLGFFCLDSQLVITQ